MLSLYEILKASKTGIAPDMWTALVSMNWGGADSGHEVKELTGIPPLSFTADGTPLLDYLISGNMSQTGTPTPSNPVDVNGVGVGTENLFDISLLEQGGWFATAGTVPTKMAPNTTSYATRTRYKQIVPLLASTLSLYCPDNVKINYVWIDANGISLGGSGWQKNGGITTAPEQAVYMTFILGLDGDIECTLNDFYDINLVAGSIAPESYEPYGYKIPISSGGVTTNIYLGSTQTTRQIKKLVLTGEENWSRAGDAVGQTPYFRIAYFTSAKPTNVVCTHYISPNGNISGSNQVEGTKVQTSSEVEIALIVRPPEFAVWSADDFKSFLAQQYATGTPVTIWYVLATPETAAVNEPLMKIGGYADTLSMEQAGVQIPTLHGNTVIDVETELKPSEMYIKYQK